MQETASPWTHKPKIVNESLLFTLSEHTKGTDFVPPTGYYKNNNFHNRPISRTFDFGAQKNCLIETLLLNA